METKICTKCKKEYPTTSEYWNKLKNGKYGLRSICNSCVKEYNKKLRSTPEAKEKNRIAAIEWRKNNPDKVLIASRKNYKEHGNKHNETRREKYHTDMNYRLKRVAYDKKYYESGRRLEINSKPEYKEAARIRSKKRRLNPDKKEHDYKRNAEWVANNKAHLKELWKQTVKELKPSYVAGCMRKKITEVDPEVIKTKRIIIQLKRELRLNNIKIR